MIITRVAIEHFRSIRKLEFEPTKLCALIGGNNTGKSNVLKALDIVLGDRWPGANSVSDEDFFGYDDSEPISISVWFDTPQEVRGDVGDPKQVWGVAFNVSRYKRATGRHKKGDIKTDFVCIDGEGESVQVLRRPNSNKRPFSQEAKVTAAIRESLPSVFIDVDRSASYHLSGSRYSILGRLLLGISKQFKEDKARYKEFKEKFEETRAVLRIDAFVELERKVVEHLQAHTGLPDVSVILDDVDPINLYKTFSVLFQDESTPQPVSAERMGSGIQSAVVISLLQAYRELRRENAVLLFEEPELFLHPHGRRHLFKLLCSLADTGTQVIYTTHSQDFVDLTRLDCVSLVSCTPDNGTKVVRPRTAAIGDGWKEKLRIAKHFGSPRDEVFFADSVVLVEGRTELGAISLAASMAEPELDLDRLNCSVLEVGGKRSLPIMIEVIKALHKRLLVVYDTDTHLENEDAVRSNNALNENIEAVLGDNGKSLPLDPYFEAVVGMEGAKKRDKERRMLEFVGKAPSWNEIPDPLKQLIERIREIA